MRLIKPLYFFLAFAVGLIFVYFTSPPPEIVMKFPSPYNSGKIKYKDELTDACYVYEAVASACPADQSLIKMQPMQTSASAK